MFHECVEVFPSWLDHFSSSACTCLFFKKSNIYNTTFSKPNPMMSFWLIAFYILILKCIHSQDIITTPTRTEGSNQYFDNEGRPDNNYRYDTIICGTDHCNLICDANGGCYDTTVNASISQTLSITCKGNSACEELSISGPPSKQLNLYCAEDIQSCKSAVIDVPDTDGVNVICNFTSLTDEDGTCLALQLNAANSTNVDIQCGMVFRYRYIK